MSRVRRASSAGRGVRAPPSRAKWTTSWPSTSRCASRELVAEGTDAADARARAIAEFGDLERTRAYCRDMDERIDRAARHAERCEAWRQDVRYAVRTLRRSPAFAVVSIITLALAIGANTAVFSVARAVLLSPLPFGAPTRLVHIYGGDRLTGASTYPFSPRRLRRLPRPATDLHRSRGGTKLFGHLGARARRPGDRVGHSRHGEHVRRAPRAGAIWPYVRVGR